MAERIFKAVAAPQMFLFAPLIPAGASLGLWAVLMMFSQVIFGGGANPLWFIMGAFTSHIALIVLGFKEPHLSTVMQARGQSMRPTTNLISAKGFRNKYVP